MTRIFVNVWNDYRLGINECIGADAAAFAWVDHLTCWSAIERAQEERRLGIGRDILRRMNVEP